MDGPSRLETKKVGIWGNQAQYIIPAFSSTRVFGELIGHSQLGLVGTSQLLQKPEQGQPLPRGKREE